MILWLLSLTDGGIIETPKRMSLILLNPKKAHNYYMTVTIKTGTVIPVDLLLQKESMVSGFWL